MKRQRPTNSCIVEEAFLTKSPFNIALLWVAGVDFEFFLQQTAEGIMDRVVRELISEADRIVFEESLDVTV